MTLRHLIQGIAFFTPLLASIQAGWTQGFVLGAFVGFVCGLLLGVASFGSVAAFYRWVARQPRLTPEPLLSIVAAWLLIPGIFAWIFAFSIVGDRLTTLLLSLNP